jgi:hypothetical protein
MGCGHTQDYFQQGFGGHQQKTMKILPGLDNWTIKRLGFLGFM